MEDSVVSMVPWIRVISVLIGWTFFIIVLSMFKNFFTQGFSMALADFLLKNCTEDQRVKLLRWLADGDLIIEHLKKYEDLLENKK